MCKVVWMALLFFSFIAQISFTRSQDNNIVLLMGGYKGENDRQEKVFLFNTKDLTQKNCINYASPHIVEGSLGAIMKDSNEEEKYFATCGGKGPDNAGKCFKYKDGKWERSSAMFRQYEYGGSGVHLSDSSFMITGGYHIYSIQDTPDKDSEILRRNKWVSGPTLPYAIAYHCAIQIDSNTTMIIGGEIENKVSPRTFIYNWTSDTWRAGPELNIARKYHSCGLHEGKIIITGGENEHPLKVTEIFDPVLNKIFFGPKLNQSVTKAAMVSLDQNELYLIGGYSSYLPSRIEAHKVILQYMDSGSWREVTQLSEIMFLHSAHQVPPSFWHKCESSSTIVIRASFNSIFIFTISTFLV